MKNPQTTKTATASQKTPQWTKITDIRDPAYGHATHEHPYNGGEEPKLICFGKEMRFWRDPQNERWLGKKPQAHTSDVALPKSEHSPLPSNWHDCDVAEKQIKDLQRNANNAQALAEVCKSIAKLSEGWTSEQMNYAIRKAQTALAQWEGAK